jgi:hypothetical protein
MQYYQMPFETLFDLRKLQEFLAGEALQRCRTEQGLPAQCRQCSSSGHDAQVVLLILHTRAGHAVQAHAAPTIDPDTPHNGHYGNYSDFLFQSACRLFKLDARHAIHSRLSTPALMSEDTMGPLVWRRVAQLAEQHATLLPGGKVRHHLNADTIFIVQGLPGSGISGIIVWYSLTMSTSAFACKPQSVYTQVAFPAVVLYVGLQMNRYIVKGSPVAMQIAKNLKIASQLHAVAGKILAGIKDRQHGQASDKPMFNGIHLRVENDASSWWSRWGSVENLWAAYLQECKLAGLSKELPLYMASGLLTYCRICKQQTALRLAPYCSRLLSKYDMLTSNDISGLHSEQLAAIDFLVIAQSQLFVGNAKSTFSWHLREYRALHGISGKDSSWLLDAREPSWTQLLEKIATF